jgi:aminoglycoside phosphotransferase (APT) family kinase protein
MKSGQASQGLTPAIGVLLANRLHDRRWIDCEVELLAGGFSNLTFVVRSSCGEVIVRRPPLGHVLPTAHDMLREFRVMSALAETPVPVPRTYFAIAAGSEGLEFGCMVTERVVGHVCRADFPVGYADSPAEKRALGERLIDVLAALHNVEPQTVGLGDLGRPDGFMSRQVRRWSEQWERSRTEAAPEWSELQRRLASHVPAQSRAAIVHGDYRLDNAILHPSDPARIEAVLDWEMSTLGDPLADLGALLAVWAEPDDDDVRVAARVVPALTAAQGFPSREELVERYARATNIEVAAIDWYIAFAYFKLAVVCQGIAARHAAGATVGEGFDDAAGFVDPLIRAGLSVIA